LEVEGLVIVDTDHILYNLAELLIKTLDRSIFPIKDHQSHVDHVYFNRSFKSVLVHDNGRLESKSEIMLIHAHITVIKLISMTCIYFPFQKLTDLLWLIIERLNLSQSQNLILYTSFHRLISKLIKLLIFIILVVIALVKHIDFHDRPYVILIYILNHVFKLQSLLLGIEVKLNQTSFEGYSLSYLILHVYEVLFTIFH
jgi:hypothetical protein